ncbi:MAG TPA: EVE domain-containing protein [Xanthomonadaceae bacterium]|nr:EVE domain-containing protein [Xanthomonadaceae bacterium]
MTCWLVKSEPADFSIADLERVGREPWTGVRNYQARNYMRDDMRVGDPVLLYHSSCPEPGVAGVARVASAAYPDPTQFERRSDYYDPKSTRQAPRWQLVEVEFVRRLGRIIGLDEIRAQSGRLGEIALLQRGNRLSVMPLTRRQFDQILRLE